MMLSIDKRHYFKKRIGGQFQVRHEYDIVSRMDVAEAISSGQNLVQS